MRPRKLVPVAAGLTLLLAAAACRQRLHHRHQRAGAEGIRRRRLNLKGVCPDTVVIQTDWFPESEYGYLYQLLGPGYKIDKKKKMLSAARWSPPARTPASRWRSATAARRSASSRSARRCTRTSRSRSARSPATRRSRTPSQPTLAVVAPLEISPIMIVWDKDKHPDFNTIADIGQTNTKILYYQTDTYMQYLLGAGLVRASQLDGCTTARRHGSSSPTVRSPTPGSPPRSRTSSRPRCKGQLVQHEPAADQRHRLPDVRRGARDPRR